MKKTISVLLIVFLFCSCGAKAEDVLEEENISFGESAVLEEIKEEKNEEKRTGKLSSDTPRYEEYQEKIIIEYIENRAVFYDTRHLILEEKGLSAYIRNAELYDGWYFGAEMVITNGEKEISFPFEGFYYYYDGMSVPGTVFGAFAKIDEENIAFIGHKTAVVINTENFERADFSPEIPDYGRKELWVNMIAHNKEEARWYLAITPLDEKNPEETAHFSHFLVFDEEGNLLWGTEIRRSLCGVFGLKDQWTVVASPTFLSYAETSKIFNKNLVITEYFSNGGCFIDAERGNYYTWVDAIEISKGKRTFKACFYYATENGYEDSKTVFFILENGVIKDGFTMDSDIFDDFSYSYDENNVSVDFSADGKTVVVKDDLYGSVLRADFEQGICDIWHEIENRHLKEEIAKSPDGKTSLYKAGYTEGLESIGFDVIQKDNATGRLTHLSCSGSGYGETGYLKNGDCYVMTSSSLEIFNPEGEKIFDLGEKMPLGYYENETMVRHLLTFRRNPDNKSFIIVYYEGPKYVESQDLSDEFGSRLGLGHTYRFGFLDSEGNLLESYDTGWEVWSDFYSGADINMRYSEKELKIFVKTGAKYRGGFIGTFDMKTHEFTVEPFEE